MADLDISAGVGFSVQIPAGAKTAGATGTGVDTSRHRSVTAIIDAGTITDGEHTFEVEESDDDSTWTTVPDGRLSTPLPVLDDSEGGGETHVVGVLSSGRYVRIVSEADDTTTGGVYGAYLILTEPRNAAP